MSKEYAILINMGWLTKKLIKFTVVDEFAVTKFRVFICRTLDPDDGLIHYCLQGDTNKVRELFVTGQNSPFDRDSHGFSLIKLTLSGLAIVWESDTAYLNRVHHQIALLRFLLFAGVDPSMETIGLELAGSLPEIQYFRIIHGH